MYPTIMPPPAALETPSALDRDVTALMAVLEATDPDLWAAELPGETDQERAARYAAAADIADDLLAEQAALAAEELLGGWF